MKHARRILFLILFIVILGADQFTKYLAATLLVEGESIKIIPGLFDLTLVYNRGAAFGLFSGLPDIPRRIALWGVATLALIAVGHFMYKEAKNDNWSKTALVGILAGACGNIIDRFRFDSVVDFLDFYINSYHWPAFNIADSAICVGVGVLIFRMSFSSQKQEVKTN